MPTTSIRASRIATATDVTPLTQLMREREVVSCTVEISGGFRVLIIWRSRLVRKSFT